MKDIPDYFGFPGTLAQQVVNDFRAGQLTKTQLSEKILDWREAGQTDLADFVQKLADTA